MLKWTVINKRSCEKESLQEPRSAEKTKRRRSSNSRRRSQDKENRFTSTPIKSGDYFQGEALRDVSNITPKDATEKLFSPKHVKYKKKKRCLDPSHKEFPTNYFKAFESVDSHIGGADPCGCKDPPHKKPKIDPVNDFLKQIAFVQSPEDKIPVQDDQKELKVSPLVHRFLDLRFTKKDPHENSSYINELSLDELVNVILDNSVKDNIPNRRSELENELNESREENFFNTKQEKRASFCDKSSTDSGFRSNSDNEAVYRLPEIINCDKTIINLEETFNERCVDDPIVNTRPRKRSLSQDDVSMFTLKRQKCIRRRRLTDDDGKALNATFCINEDLTNDNSFDSNVMEKMDVGNSFIGGRIRRCLLFDSPGSEKSGSVDLEIRCANDELSLTVIRCNNLSRSNGKPVNAYIKVSLNQRVGDGQNGRDTLQRTAVQAESTRPTFNHTFRLALCLQKEDGKHKKLGIERRVYVEVWHRDRMRRRSELLGCMSFAVENAIEKDIRGRFYLLPQSTGRCQNVPMTVGHQSTSEATLEDQQHQAIGTMCESRSSMDDVATTVFAGEDLEDLRKSTIGCKAALSEQQKLADENLFLRYLELDPTEGPEAIPAALQRKATGNKYGRTPFTTTKKLTRQSRAGFGFSVVWTHPPRIERVEKGLPADRAGILPGDYVIFVDKHNVVMMPEIDILNLIRSYGNQLTLEIFRRNSSRNGSVPYVKSSANAEITTGLPAPSLSTQRRPSTVCSTTNTASIDYSRRKLQLPQITFSSEVGNGVLV